jgi:DNA replication ATP-dependent helicase Dna2
MTDSLSDYGDDDFDDDTLIELEANIGTAASTQQVSTAVSKEVPVLQPEERKTIHDEFGDMDDELFDATEELLSQQSVHKPSIPAPDSPSCRVLHATAAQQRNPEVEDEFDDDFGADIDFEAVELAATQAHQQASKANTTVR